jgi:hypothetical protein
MDASEFNERVKLLQRAMGERQRKNTLTVQLVIVALAAGLLGISALLRSWQVFLQGAILLAMGAFTLHLRAKLKRPSGKNGARGFALDASSADLETAIPSEDGTVSYICEDSVVVGPRREVRGFAGQDWSISYDEDKRALKLQIQDGLDERDRRGLAQATIRIPLPASWSERHTLRLVKRWSVWIAQGAAAGRAVPVPPPSGPDASQAANG